MIKLPCPLREADTGNAAGAAPVTPPPAAPSAVTPAAPPAATPPAKTDAEIRAAVFAELGVADVEEVKAAIALAKAAEDAKKSDAEKLVNAKAEADAAKAKVSGLELALKAHAESQLAALTPEQRAAVQALAGDDPAKVIPVLNTLRVTWAPTALLGNTAPPPGSAPAPGSVQPAVDHKAKLAALERNPYAHAAYAARHFRDLNPDL